MNHFLTICLLGSMSFARAQMNLVFNPGFELYTTCPGGPSNFYATGWDNTQQTSDYFNICASTSFGAHIPSNWAGYQPAYSGNAYCGLITYQQGSFYRESFSSQLISPLVVGQKYFASLRVCWADKPNTSAYATNKTGMLFSTKQFSLPANPAPTNNYAHVFSSSVISDSVNWTLISGSFIADSVYNYINIGNFFNDVNTTTVNYTSSFLAYYYIDDIRLSTDSVFGLSLSAGELEKNEKIVLYPNPVKNILNITVHQNSDLEMYNLFGKKTECKKLNLGSNEIDLSNQAAGIYIISISSGDGTIRRKIIKE